MANALSRYAGGGGGSSRYANALTYGPIREQGWYPDRPFMPEPEAGTPTVIQPPATSGGTGGGGTGGGVTAPVVTAPTVTAGTAGGGGSGSGGGGGGGVDWAGLGLGLLTNPHTWTLVDRLINGTPGAAPGTIGTPATADNSGIVAGSDPPGFNSGSVDPGTNSADTGNLGNIGTPGTSFGPIQTADTTFAIGADPTGFNTGHVASGTEVADTGANALTTGTRTVTDSGTAATSFNPADLGGAGAGFASAGAGTIGVLNTANTSGMILPGTSLAMAGETAAGIAAGTAVADTTVGTAGGWLAPFVGAAAPYLAFAAPLIYGGLGLHAMLTQPGHTGASARLIAGNDGRLVLGGHGGNDMSSVPTANAATAQAAFLNERLGEMGLWVNPGQTIDVMGGDDFGLNPNSALDQLAFNAADWLGGSNQASLDWVRGNGQGANSFGGWNDFATRAGWGQYANLGAQQGYLLTAADKDAMFAGTNGSGFGGSYADRYLGAGQREANALDPNSHGESGYNFDPALLAFRGGVDPRLGDPGQVGGGLAPGAAAPLLWTMADPNAGAQGD